jgi:hypothetical protein
MNPKIKSSHRYIAQYFFNSGMVTESRLNSLQIDNNKKGKVLPSPELSDSRLVLCVFPFWGLIRERNEKTDGKQTRRDEQGLILESLEHIGSYQSCGAPSVSIKP